MHELNDAPAADHIGAATTAAEAALWDRTADRYDSMCGHGLRSPEELAAWRHLLVRLLPGHGKRILDIGTGTGFLAFHLAALGHDVVGVDVSARMLDVARRRARTERIEGLEFVRGAAHDLTTLESGTFDAVISRHVLWTLPYPEEAITEWIRVGGPGSRIIAIDGLWRGRGAVSRAVATAERLTSVRRRRSSRPGIRPLADLQDTGPAAAAFARAGLVPVHAEELAWLDAIERRAMTPVERLRYRWHRYLVEGQSPPVVAPPP